MTFETWEAALQFLFSKALESQTSIKDADIQRALVNQAAQRLEAELKKKLE